MDKNQLFINKVNELLKKVNFRKLDYSCNVGDKAYARNFLDEMHKAFVDVYGTDYLDCASGEFVDLPAVIRGEKTGKIAIGLVNIDLQSSGEHYGSYMFTEIGVVDDTGSKVSERMSDYISKMFIPYQYWYTPYVSGDHHVNFDNMPDDVAAIMDYEIPNMENTDYNISQ